MTRIIELTQASSVWYIPQYEAPGPVWLDFVGFDVGPNASPYLHQKCFPTLQLARDFLAGHAGRWGKLGEVRVVPPDEASPPEFGVSG